MKLKVHTPEKVFRPISPYAQAVEVSEAQRFLFISGTMGLELDGSVAGDFETQANRVWANIDATLRSAGMGPTNLVKLTVYLANRETWPLAAQIRQKYLGDHRVAIAVFEVRLAEAGWLIEVEGIAAS